MNVVIYPQSLNLVTACHGHVVAPGSESKVLLRLPAAPRFIQKGSSLKVLLDRDADLATVHEMDVLLSWNCRHIASAAIQARPRRLAEKAGFSLPVLCTPDELAGELYE